jgi:zeta-carotene desaturase
VSRAVSHDVIVAGAGFAGLSAACALAERRLRVLVLEARPSIGGRATAFTDPATGERVDNGQHVLLGCYDETFAFLRRIGAEQHLSLQRDLSVDMVDRDGRWSRLSCPHLPPPLHLLVGALHWPALSWRDRLALARIGPALVGRVKTGRSKQGLLGAAFRQFAASTVREWLAAHGQTPRLHSSPSCGGCSTALRAMPRLPCRRSLSTRCTPSQPGRSSSITVAKCALDRP